jgi:hypothetical protein
VKKPLNVHHCIFIKSTTVVDLTKKLIPQHGATVVDLRSPKT